MLSHVSVLSAVVCIVNVVSPCLSLRLSSSDSPFKKDWEKCQRGEHAMYDVSNLPATPRVWNKMTDEEKGLQMNFRGWWARGAVGTPGRTGAMFYPDGASYNLM